MARLHRAAAALVATALIVLTQTTAHAELPPAPTAPAGPAAPATPAPVEDDLTPPIAKAAVGHIMVVLDVLGIVEKGAPPKTTATERAIPRTPTWFAPATPPTPLTYASLVVAKF